MSDYLKAIPPEAIEEKLKPENKPDWKNRLSLWVGDTISHGLVGNKALESFPNATEDQAWEAEKARFIDYFFGKQEFGFGWITDAQREIALESLNNLALITKGKRFNLDELKDKRPHLIFHTTKPRWNGGGTFPQRVVISLDDIITCAEEENGSHKYALVRGVMETIKKNQFIARLASADRNITVFRYSNPGAPFRYGAYQGNTSPHDLAVYKDYPFSWWTVLTEEFGSQANLFHRFRDETKEKKLHITTIGRLEEKGVVTADYIDQEAIIFADLGRDFAR